MTLFHFGAWRAVRRVHGHHETETMRPTERSHFILRARTCRFLGG
jgi:hypothetical protein